MELSNEKISTINLPLRQKRVRMELLDFQDRVVDSIEAQCVSGSLSKDATNDLRRSGSLTLAIPSVANATTFLDYVDGYSIEYGGKIWLDKVVRVSIGIDDYTTTPITTQWYKFGSCLIDAPTRDYSGETYTISFNLIDRMAKLTGLRQGQMTALNVMIEKGSTVSQGSTTYYQSTKTYDALQSVITDIAGIQRYSIYPMPDKYVDLPYDIKIDSSATVFDLLSKFMDILSGWQMYFDDDDVFRIEPIPSGTDNLVYPLNKAHLVTDNMNVDFQKIKNQTVVYGRLLEPTYTATSVTYTNNKITLGFDFDSTAFKSYVGATIIAFNSLNTYNTVDLSTIQMSFNGALTLNMQMLGFEGVGNIPSYSLIPNTLYCIRLFYTANTASDGSVGFSQLSHTSTQFEFLGKEQVSWCMVNDNKESPFYINQNFDTQNYYAGMARSNGVATSLTPSESLTPSDTLTPAGSGITPFYHLTINDEDNVLTSSTGLANNTIITFMADIPSVSGQLISVISSSGTTLLTNIPIVQDTYSGSTRPQIVAGKIGSDYTIYELRMEQVGNTWQAVLVGRHPYALINMLLDGEYDNIYSDELAKERATWELFKTSNLENTISLSMIPNYLLDVNAKIPYSRSWTENLEYPEAARFLVRNAQPPTEYLQLVAKNTDISQESSQQNFYVKQELYDYFMIKSITYPLGLDTTPQTLSAIQIYDDKNYVGSDLTVPTTQLTTVTITPTLVHCSTFIGNPTTAYKNNAQAYLKGVVTLKFFPDKGYVFTAGSLSQIGGAYSWDWDYENGLLTINGILNNIEVTLKAVLAASKSITYTLTNCVGGSENPSTTGVGENETLYFITNSTNYTFDNAYINITGVSEYSYESADNGRWLTVWLYGVTNNVTIAVDARQKVSTYNFSCTCIFATPTTSFPTTVRATDSLSFTLNVNTNYRDIFTFVTNGFVGYNADFTLTPNGLYQATLTVTNIIGDVKITILPENVYAIDAIGFNVTPAATNPTGMAGSPSTATLVFTVQEGYHFYDHSVRGIAGADYTESYNSDYTVATVVLSNAVGYTNDDGEYKRRVMLLISAG